MTSAGVVVDSVGKLIVASTALPPDREVDPSADPMTKLIAAIRSLKPLKHGPASEAKIRECARALGRACIAFGRVMRTTLKVDDVDAILRAFPGFSMPESSTAEDFDGPTNDDASQS